MDVYTAGCTALGNQRRTCMCRRMSRQRLVASLLTLAGPRLEEMKLFATSGVPTVARRRRLA
eukprot:11583211-Alexandrium_andersonii.AAC.1